MKLSNKLSLLALLIPACATSYLQAWYFIFDLPRTLVEVDSGSFLKEEMGTSSVIWYTLTFNNPTKLKSKTFAVLNELGEQEGIESHLARDPDGDILPQIYCDFLLGMDNPFKKAKPQIHAHEKSNERDLIENITKAIFSPEKLAKHAKIVKDGHKLLQECKTLHGADSVYIMSNLNIPALQELFKAKHMQPVMKHFTGNRIFISQTMKALLPHPSCFEALARKSMDVSECIFISSMPWNVQAARNAGLKAVLIDNKDFKKARKELVALGVL